MSGRVNLAILLGIVRVAVLALGVVASAQILEGPADVVPAAKRKLSREDGPDLDGHFALRVRSYAQTRAFLEAQGIPMEDRPQKETPWPQIFVTDPDDNVIELIAAAREDAHEG